MKYRVVNDVTMHYHGHVLHRIRAMKDIPEYGVKVGDLGGWVEGSHDLSQDGRCWIGRDARVYERAYVDEDARVFGNAELRGTALADGQSAVFGNTLMTERSHVGGHVIVYGHARLSGDEWYHHFESISDKPRTGKPVAVKASSGLSDCKA